MIQQNINLKKLSTFNIGGNAEFYSKVSTKEELVETINFAKSKNIPITVLGSASNVIISDNGIKGLVIQLANKDITVINNNDEYSIINAGAGVIWDDFVQYSVSNKLYGVENLSLIPGTVGASAIQNIGAYGQEVSNTIHSIYAYDLEINDFVEILSNECDFSYRTSIFNTSSKGRYIIFSINYKLNYKGEFSLGYQDMAYFREDNNLTLNKIRSEIINIRNKKLPDYNKIPNVGSFFKNLVLTKVKFNELVEKAKLIDLEKSNKLKSFETSKSEVKIPTALLIDLCGLKGYKQDHIGIYDKHALIVINHSMNGTCEDVLNFSDYITNTIKNKLGVTINREPTVIK